MIDLEPKVRAEVLDILKRRLPGISVRVFGSRARGTKKRFADLDLLLLTERPLSPVLRGQLESDFSESNVPYRVDIVDAAAADPAFLVRIAPTSIPLE